LRFPRLERIRDKTDKDWYDCMTLNELNELKEKNDGNLASGKHLELSDAENEDEYEPSIKKKRTINRKVTVQVSDRFKGVDSSMIKKESELFSDKEFCVINGNDTYTKKDLETKIIGKLFLFKNKLVFFYLKLAALYIFLNRTWRLNRSKSVSIYFLCYCR
jgi:DNA ligase-4